MNKNKIVLLITLILLLLSVSYAAEVSNDTTSNDDTLTKNVQKSTDTQTVEQNVIKEETKNNKEIKKNVANKTTKTSNKIIEVNSYDNLTYGLSYYNHENITLNIQSDITLYSPISIGDSNKVTINGNGHTIDGNNLYKFLDISKSNTVTINNLVITNCVDEIGYGIIYNEGDLTLNNSKFIDNIKLHWCICNRGKLNIQNSEFINSSNDNSVGLIQSEKYLTVNNSKFIDNYGLVICVSDSEVIIENSIFKRDFRLFYGVFDFTNCSTILNNLNITTNNTIRSYGGSLTIINSTISDNINNYGNLTVINSILKNNTAEYEGGTIYNTGNLTVINSIFNNNTAIRGGAIYNTGNLTAINSIFKNNTAEYEGGTIYNENGNVKINNSIFSNNEAKHGSAIVLSNSTLTIDNSSFNNKAGYYSSVGYEIVESIYTNNNKKTLISNSKFADGGIRTINGSITITNTEFDKTPLYSNDYIKLVNVTVKSNKTSVTTLSYRNATIINSTFTKTGKLGIENPDEEENITSNLNIINSVFQECVGEINAININITNSTFNKIRSGSGVIYSRGIFKITDSKFINNIQETYSNRGIITTNGNLTISNTIFKNNTSVGSAILVEEYSNASINKCNFTNNTGVMGGAINNHNQIKVNNCIFNNNRGNNGGAIYAYSNPVASYETQNINIKNSIFTNNTAEYDGGAISAEMKLIMSNVSITYNKAKNNGGAIDGFEYISLHNSNISFNKAGNNGGAINGINYYSIHNSNISFNKAGNNGGAIYGNDHNSIYNDYTDQYYEKMRKNTNILSGNIISYNTAENNGGAIHISRIYNIIKNNTFSYNKAKNGSAIYTDFKIEFINVTGYTTEYDYEGIPYQYPIINGNYTLPSNGNTKIINNRFIQNAAKVKGTAIIINGTGNTVKKNINDTLSIYSSTIHINGLNNSITNNIFEDNITYTKITLTVPTKTTINGTKITIKGKLTTYEGKILTNTNIKLKINTKTVTIKTDNKGTFNYTHKTYKTGTNNVTTSYPGNTKYAPTKTTKTFKVITETKITINKINTTQYKDKIIIKGKLTKNNGAILANTKIKLKINNRTATLKTNKQGIYNYTHKTSTIGKNNVTITFPGNTNYKASTNKTTFTVTKATTKATINKITQKTYKQNMTITGKLTDQTGTILKNTKIKVKVNTKTYTVKTNSKGIYTLKITANKVGTNNVTVTYAGNKYYKAMTKKTTYKTVARATKLTINKINTTSKGKTVKITGKLTDNLKSPVMNSLVKIKINKKTVNVKTNRQGVYTYNYKTTTNGTNNITITFAGSTNYKKTSSKTSFKVN